MVLRDLEESAMSLPPDEIAVVEGKKRKRYNRTRKNGGIK